MIDFIKIIVTDLQQSDIIWHSMFLDYNKTETRLIKETGEIKEIMLSEETSLITTNPIFLLDNAVTTLRIKNNENAELTEPDFSEIPSSDEIPENMKLATSFSSYEHSIESQDYRYESGWGNKSEFVIVAARIDESGNVHQVLKDGNGYFRTWQ